MDAFRIDGPTAISFSGGRTSAFMLWKVLETHGGLPKDAVICFANTGLEHENTLRFVERCGQEWGVNINWLEYRTNEVGYEAVNFATASRNGEPFEAIIKKRNYLPNPVTRFCTSELKIRTMHKWLRNNWEALGWDAADMEWDQMIGIRSDEGRRVTKIRARGHSTETTKETMRMPLADAGYSVQDVNEFWSKQPFNLELDTFNGRTLAGNCVLCFLKPAAQIQSLIREDPSRGVWWAKMELTSLASKPSGAVFRSDRPSYQKMMDFSRDQVDMFDANEEGIACFCGD